jgi:hypothetical protein
VTKAGALLHTIHISEEQFLSHIKPLVH